MKEFDKCQLCSKNIVLRHPLTKRKFWCNITFAVRGLTNDMVCNKSRNDIYFYLKHLPKNTTARAAYFKTEWQNENAEKVIHHYNRNNSIYHISHQFERCQDNVSGQWRTHVLSIPCLPWTLPRISCKWKSLIVIVVFGLAISFCIWPKNF